MKNIVEWKELNPPVILYEDKKGLKEYYEQKKEQWENIYFYEITYLSKGLKVKGVILVPKLQNNIKLPCLIFNRGGSNEFGLIDDTKIFHDLTDFAAMGMVVIASQYRGNAGGEGKDEYCGEDINDIIELKKIIDSFNIIDPDKIAMYGASRGGLMTYKVLAEVDWVKCAVIKAGSTDEVRGYEQRPELKEFRKNMYDVNSMEENIKRSPLRWSNTYLSNIKTPILLMHGTADNQVDTLDTIEMSLRLVKNKIPFEMVVFEGDDHRLRKNKLRIRTMIRNWLYKHKIVAKID